MQKYECQACGYIYNPQVDDEDNGAKPGTTFENLPEDWEYSLCGASKDEFEPIEQKN